jgi:hypothetical protein
MQAIMATSSHALFSRSRAMGSGRGRFLAGADDVLDAGVDAMRDVDVGALAQPALRVRGSVGDPQGVAPAVGGLEQGQLSAEVRLLAADEDPHGFRPGLPLVAIRALAQQPVSSATCASCVQHLR